MDVLVVLTVSVVSRERSVFGSQFGCINSAEEHDLWRRAKRHLGLVRYRRYTAGGQAKTAAWPLSRAWVAGEGFDEESGSTRVLPRLGILIGHHPEVHLIRIE